jgi:hypothetical protein
MIRSTASQIDEKNKQQGGVEMDNDLHFRCGVLNNAETVEIWITEAQITASTGIQTMSGG